MRTVFSTVDVPSAEAFDYWQDVACANIQKAERETFDRRNFYGELKAGTLGDVSILAWQSAPSVSRCYGTDDDLILTLHSSRTVIEFSGRSFETRRNAIYLMDSREPQSTRALEPHERLQVRLPRAEMECRASLADAVNRPIPLRPDIKLLVTFVRSLARIGPSRLTAASRTATREQVLNLIAVALRSKDKPVRRPRDNADRLRALHAKGLSDRQIGHRMRLDPIVIRAQRRRLGLSPNKGDAPFGTEERDWLALQLALGGKADGLLEQFREVLLNVRRQPLGGQEDPD